LPWPRYGSEMAGKLGLAAVAAVVSLVMGLLPLSEAGAASVIKVPTANQQKLFLKAVYADALPGTTMQTAAASKDLVTLGEQICAELNANGTTPKQITKKETAGHPDRTETFVDIMNFAAIYLCASHHAEMTKYVKSLQG
jgi:Protein of unknown function (DUF732)